MNDELMLKYAQRFKIDKRIIQFLVKRGYATESAIHAFLYDGIEQLSSSSDLPNISQATELIRAVIARDESILIYGDYDCDGICAVSILYDYLCTLTAKVNYLVPDRGSEGYGLSVDVANRILSDYNASLIITVDCGVSSADAVKTLLDGGRQVLVTDHHILPSVLPDCIVVNGKLSSNKRLHDICGAMTALYLVEALSNRTTALSYIDIAAIATVADIVPLTGDNRIVVKEGLKVLNSRKRREGIRLLLGNAGFNGTKITSSDISYFIAPRINAAGRVASAKAAPSLFCVDDHLFLDEYTKKLNDYNSERQAKCDAVYTDCIRMLRGGDVCAKRVIILHNDDWELGVIGIAAAKISRVFMRPTVLLARDGDVLKGSARSTDKINLYELLDICSDLYASFGGHKGACGLSIAQEKVDEMEMRLNAVLLDEHTIDDFLCDDAADIEMDGSVDMPLIYDLERLEPTGMDNRQASFSYESPLTFSRMGSSSHIKAKINRDVELVAFGFGDDLALFNSGSDVKYICHLGINEYRGRENGQAKLTDFRLMKPSESLRDVLCALYQKQLLHKSKRDISYNEIDSIEQAAALCGRAHYGTLFITYNLDNYKRLMDEFAKQKQLPFIHSISFGTTDVNPLNAVLLGVDGKPDFGSFKRIVFLERPLCDGFIEHCMNGFYGDVYIIGNKMSIPVAPISLEFIKRVYYDIKAYGNLGKPLSSVTALQYDLYQAIKHDIVQFQLAFYLLFEWGYVTFTPDGRIKTKDVIVEVKPTVFAQLGYTIAR